MERYDIFFTITSKNIIVGLYIKPIKAISFECI